MLFPDQYVYDQDLGFLKKITRAIGKVGTKISHAVVPRSIRKLVPNELKGGTVPLLVAGGYGLKALGAGSMKAGAGKIGGKLVAGAGKVAGAAGTAAKMSAPLLLTGAQKAAEAAPHLLQAYGQHQAQAAQAQINEIETQYALENMRAQREHELTLMRLQMDRANYSTPQAYAVGPPASGGGARGGIDQNTVLLLAAAGVGVVLLTRK